MRHVAGLGIFLLTVACGGSTSSGLSGPDGGGAGGVSTGGSSTGGTSTGGTSTGGTSTGGTSTGGTGAGGAGGVAGGATCSTLCTKISEAQCPAEETFPTCVAGCQVDLASYQQACPAPSANFFACATTAGKVVCDPDGQSKFLGCNSQLVEFVKCSACIPSAADTDCEACEKGACCQELQAVYSHPDFAPYLDCVYACNDQDCGQACYTKFPNLGGPIGALATCEQSKCSNC